MKPKKFDMSNQIQWSNRDQSPAAQHSLRSDSKQVDSKQGASRQNEPLQQESHRRDTQGREIKNTNTSFHLNPDPRALTRMPATLARLYHLLPLKIVRDSKGAERLMVACCEDISTQLIQELRFMLECNIESMRVPKDYLIHAIEQAYGNAENRFSDASEGLTEIDKKVIDPPMPTSISGSNEPISEFVDALLNFGCDRRASDIHILPTLQGTIIRFRADGQLFSHPSPFANASTHAKIVQRLKILAGLSPLERSLPLDGRFTYKSGLYECDLRFASMPTQFGERITLRLHAKQATAPTLESLRITPSIVTLLEKYCLGAPRLGIVSGPTGGGKTTTLYALLQRMHALNYHIITVEDPIEHTLPDISQSAVVEGKGLGFSELIRASLRHDPDCLMIGEIRDPATARLALDAAATGHSVLTTIHANSVTGIILRLQEWGIPLSFFNEVGGFLLHQQLLPVLCPDCRVPLNDQEWEAPGCQKCELTGIRGRIPCIEILAGIGEEPNPLHSVLGVGGSVYLSKRKQLKEWVRVGIVHPFHASRVDPNFRGGDYG